MDNRALSQLVCNETLEFILVNIADSALVKPLTSNSKVSFEDGTVDSIDFIICFRPPLTVEQARAAHVQVKYRQNTIVFGQHVLRSDKEPEALEVQEEELNYLIFETHQLQYDRKKELVDCMFLTIANLPSASPTGALLEPLVDLHANFFKNTFPNRFHFLEWFPPNIDPALYGLKIDPRTIPQRSPLWFKLRGEVTGTKAYALVGFFVPTKQQDPQYSFFKPPTFTPFAKAAMRLGTLSEDAALLNYFNAYDKQQYYELGWCSAPAPFSKTWGASPDGMIQDDEMTWDKVPKEIREYYDGGDVSKPSPLRDSVSRGALEIKTSRTKLSMEAYFYPQVYMEMIVLQVVWTNLIRYKPGYGAHIYRIYRDPKIEQQLIKLWTRAFTNAARLQDIIQEADFVAMRAYFEKAARSLEPINIVYESHALMQSYNAYKQTLTVPVPQPAELESSTKRAKVDVAAVLIAQIEECAKMLKETISRPAAQEKK